MWLFTETGFVSAVQSNLDASKMMIRARDKKSLVEISALADAEILEIPNRDYPYRVITDKETFTLWMNQKIEDIDYSNFKSRVEKTRGVTFTSALHKVWDVMHMVTDTKKAKQNSLYY